MKKSSIDGNRYLDYLWELCELPNYIIGVLAVCSAASDSLRSGHSENQGFFSTMAAMVPHPRLRGIETSVNMSYNKAASLKLEHTISNGTY